MGWLDIDPVEIKDILLTHQDTDHVGAVERDSELLFKDATLYISEIESRYLTGDVRRKVLFGLYRLPMVVTDNRKVLLRDGQVLDIAGIKIECFLCPGHTWGHMVYLIDDEYLFTGDTLWFGADGGYSFINSLAEDNELAKKSLAGLEQTLQSRKLTPKSSPVTPGGRMTLILHSAIGIRSAILLRNRNSMTRLRLMTALTRQTTLGRKQEIYDWKKCGK